MNSEVWKVEADPRQSAETSSSTLEKVVLLALVTWSSVMAYQIAASGIRHDYRAYVDQWSHILAGGDP